ncbi:MAG TPA: bifunctional diaminohydroxyphosphoribosylaminopyrimidine deaminase/5-amino-6-(5-phosphoribosylamino)uracil reductase RibD [Marmoricola sp.]
MSTQGRPVGSQGAEDVDGAEDTVMLRALEIAATPGVPLGPNPRVGCVLLDRQGQRLSEGFHRGAGTPHAEVAALTSAAAAGLDVRGATAVVTLEPCNHTGRTGPCSEALIEAGVGRVVYALDDPNEVASGGADRLRAAGIDVVGGLQEKESRALNRAWLFGLAHGRPLVTWKFAATLDGRSAAADGSSRWVSSRAARLDTHRLRAECDVMLVGTNTVDVDDPALTVRDRDDLPLPQQPLRAVMGVRDLAPDRKIFADVPGAPPTVHLRTREPRDALDQLYAMGRRHVFTEGGPRLAAAFLRAGLVDEAVCYLAPKLLGAGRDAVGDLGITTISDALEFELVDTTVVGEGPDANVRLTLTPRHPEGRN